jgi:hypothetical protein
MVTDVVETTEARLLGPVALKLRYHLIGSISLPKKTLLHDNRRLPSRCIFPLSTRTGTFSRLLNV